MFCEGVRTKYINIWGIMYMQTEMNKKSEFVMVLVERTESVGFSNDQKPSLGRTGKEN